MGPHDWGKEFTMRMRLFLSCCYSYFVFFLCCLIICRISVEVAFRRKSVALFREHLYCSVNRKYTVSNKTVQLYVPS